MLFLLPCIQAPIEHNPQSHFKVDIVINQLSIDEATQSKQNYLEQRYRVAVGVRFTWRPPVVPDRILSWRKVTSPAVKEREVKRS